MSQGRTGRSICMGIPFVDTLPADDRGMTDRLALAPARSSG
jgi:hypothetical protein